MKKIFKIKTWSLLSVLFILNSCNVDLDEKIEDSTVGGELLTESNAIQLVNPPYAKLRDVYYFVNCWAMTEATTDECMYPSRGTDWEDGGQWRSLYLHTWDATHPIIPNAWNQLSQGTSFCDIALNYLKGFKQTNDTVKSLTAEVRFLKCFYAYLFLDFWGQFPYREPGNFDYGKETEVKYRKDGYDWIVAELKDLLDNNLLKEKGAVEYGRITKATAQALLAKLYMNKAHYIESGEGDWASARSMCDAILSSGKYGFDNNYFHIFTYNNESSPEIIFPIVFDDNVGGSQSSLYFYAFPLHYNQKLGTNYFGGWNGPIVTPDFLDRFNSNGDSTIDKRYKDNSTKAVSGINLGFLSGQQTGPAPTYAPLQTRQNTPLFYTKDCPLTSANEAQGVRVLKYYPNPNAANQAYQGNDFVIFRYSDILLMRAECAFRSNDPATALADVNSLRAIRGLSALGSVSLDDIFNERRRELYWEGHARQDYIRFGHFLAPHYNKPDASDKSREWFTIPQTAIDRNTNLKQNDAL